MNMSLRAIQPQKIRPKADGKYTRYEKHPDNNTKILQIIDAEHLRGQ